MAGYRDRVFDPTPFAGTIGDLLTRSAEAPARAAEIIAQAQAHAAQVKGQAWAQAGQAIGAIPGQFQQMQDQQVERKARQAEIADADAARQQAIVKRTTQLLGTTLKTAKTPEEAKDWITYLVKNGGIPADAGGTVMAILDAAGPDGYSRVQQHFLSLANADLPVEKYSEGQIGVQGVNADGTPNVVVRGPEKPVEPPKIPTRAVTVRNPDGSETTKIVEDVPGAEFPSAAPPAREQAPPATVDAAILAAQRAGDQQSVNTLLALKARMEAAGRMPERADAPEKPSVWINKGSDQLFVTPTEAAALSRQGWKSGNSREQGRPVTSGDASKIADFDTSLDDLNVLTGAVSGNDATGIAAQAGAALPNWVTNITGWGTDAKSKQAVIDRVKQVIGKALEGGVLRKEDEYKYEKILPTISDPQEVVAAKLDGLWTAIQQRRQTTLEALTDAGYDTTRFGARTPRSRKPVIGEKRMIGNQVGEWDGQGWKPVN